MVKGPRSKVKGERVIDCGLGISDCGINRTRKTGDGEKESSKGTDLLDVSCQWLVVRCKETDELKKPNDCILSDFVRNSFPVKRHRFDKVRRLH